MDAHCVCLPATAPRAHSPLSRSTVAGARSSSAASRQRRQRTWLRSLTGEGCPWASCRLALTWTGSTRCWPNLGQTLRRSWGSGEQCRPCCVSRAMRPGHRPRAGRAWLLLAGGGVAAHAMPRCVLMQAPFPFLRLAWHPAAACPRPARVGATEHTHTRMHACTRTHTLTCACARAACPPRAQCGHGSAVCEQRGPGRHVARAAV